MYLALLLSHGRATALLLGASVFSLASTPSIVLCKCLVFVNLDV